MKCTCNKSKYNPCFACLYIKAGGMDGIRAASQPLAELETLRGRVDSALVSIKDIQCKLNLALDLLPEIEYKKNYYSASICNDMARSSIEESLHLIDEMLGDYGWDTARKLAGEAKADAQNRAANERLNKELSDL